MTDALVNVGIGAGILVAILLGVIWLIAFCAMEGWAWVLAFVAMFVVGAWSIGDAIR